MSSITIDVIRADSSNVDAQLLLGLKGDTGDPAGFGSVTASVDANIGTPSVTVNTSGLDTAKNFDFEFHNLKGEKGDTGDVSDVLYDSATVVNAQGVATIPKVNYYVECATNSSANPKEFIAGGFKYVKGVIIAIKFSQGCNSLINIQANLTSKYVRYKNTIASTSNPVVIEELKLAPAIGLFLYDGTYWTYIGCVYNTATTSVRGLMSAADKTKLNGIKAGAEVNVQSDWNEADSDSDAYIQNKPSLATVATSGSYNDLSNTPSLADVALSGDYDDLLNKPSLFSGDYNDLTNKPNFATVATSGSYNDLTNKPTIPTVNDATLTVQQNGEDVATFTANASSNVTADITVPTKISDLEDDIGEVSLSELEDATVVQTLSDNEPYNYRRTNGGNGSGHREYDEIVGASVGWNQLVPIPSTNTTKTTNGITFTDNRDGSYSISGTATSNAYSANLISHAENVLISGHKYICVGIGTGVQFTDAWDATITFRGESVLVYNNPNKLRVEMALLIGSGNTVNSTVKPDMVDLTLFNSQIADYVYALEQSTAGSGVTWLKTHFPKLFDNGYQPYDSGSLKSVSGLTAHEMVGFNQWDEEWEVGTINNATGLPSSDANNIRAKNYCPCKPNTSYFFYSGNGKILRFYWYDAEQNYISTDTANNITKASPDNAYYFKVRTTDNYGGTYNHDICINLSDTSINGQYFPYEKHTYQLDSSVTLRGKYVLDNGQLKAVGDVWHPNDGIDRNYAEVDLGSLNWTYQADETRFYSADIKTLVKPSSNNAVPVNALSSIFNVVAVSYFDGNMQLCAGTTGNLFVRDTAFTDATAFKTAMSGVKLVYERNATVTETATPYTSPQWCDSKGTEEYVGSELPVGHNTDYPMTLVDTMPSANGTYEPRVTVTNGVRTITWQSV